MSFIDQVDPEILGALDAHQAERYSAIGDNPPKGAPDDRSGQPRNASQPPADGRRNYRSDDSRAGLRYSARHL